MFRQPCCFASYDGYILAPEFPDPLGSAAVYLQRDVYFLLRHVRTRQMHASFDANDALACFDHLGRKVRGTPASVPNSARRG